MGTMTLQVWLDLHSNHPPITRRIKRLLGPLATREFMQISASEMKAILNSYGVPIEKRETIYTWERAERDRALPHRYWSDRYMTREAAVAYHRLIADITREMTNGRLRARVKGYRRWHVYLAKVKTQ